MRRRFFEVIDELVHSLLSDEVGSGLSSIFLIGDTIFLRLYCFTDVVLSIGIGIKTKATSMNVYDQFPGKP